MFREAKRKTVEALRHKFNKTIDVLYIQQIKIIDFYRHWFLSQKEQ